MNKKDVILCRCEDVSLEDVQRLLEQGYVTFEDLKRQLRIGMGPCQGQTCGELIRKEIARFLNQKAENIPGQKTRPLTIGVPLVAIKDGADDER
jgi:bacterioferritin-associated ferredoxin